MNNQTDIPKIRSYLKTILYVMTPAAIFITIASALIIYACLESHLGKGNPKTTIIAATVDLQSGILLTTNHLGTMSVGDIALPNGYIVPRDYQVLLGHRTISPITRKTAITWFNTDIPVNKETNKP